MGALVLGGSALAGWWYWQHWTPDRARYPVQGLWLDHTAGPVDWTLVKNGPPGAQFVYLTASIGADDRDPAFIPALDAARAAGLQVGTVHVYDLCAPAERQAGNFVTTVARDPRLLPAAIAIDLDPVRCPDPPGDAAIDSELTTFLNQVERHLGRTVVLMPSPAVERRYHFAARIDRNVWVGGPFWPAAPSARGWVLWTANDRLRSAGVGSPVRWVVVQP